VNASARVKLLFGPYSAPPVRPGHLVQCAIRGEVEVVGMSAGPITWPIGRNLPRGRQRFLILTGDLVEAVRRESVAALCHWWGVGEQTVWRWRKALGVGAITEGTSRLKAEAIEPHKEALQAAARPSLSSPQRREKIAASKRGKSRPPGSAKATGKGHLGKRHSEETRRKMSEAHRRRGSGGADTGRPWTEAEDELVRTLTSQEAAERTGRPIKAIWSRRQKLRVNPAD
jgi:hypothetical protein